MQQNTQLVSNQVLVNSILKSTNLNFLIIDINFSVLEHQGMLFAHFEQVSNGEARASVYDLLPEIAELDLPNGLFVENLTVPITTPKIQHRSPEGSTLFLRLHFEKLPNVPYVLILIEEVTDEGELEIALRKSIEEIHMLHAKMDHTSARLNRLLERFMPARVARKIIHDEEVPFPGSNTVRECSILFTDMRNFTAFAEQVSPEETVKVLNRYFDVISASIELFEGSIIQLIGDLLMATFNVPDDQPDHALRACLAALEIQESLQKINRIDDDLPKLGFGIGISTGLVTPSYIGSKNRFQFATVGDVTNVAFHLCSNAKENQIIISNSTLEEARGYSTLVKVEPLGEMQLKRRRKPLLAYELKELVSIQK
ncbi:MAG: adenylate/guanylate cyclase domain-containing protein [Chloroflexota bacterium]